MNSVKVRERAWRKNGVLEPDGSGRTLSWETYEAVLRFQGGRCAVCDKVFFVGDKRSAAADHDHKTGLFRGVLCGVKRGCNLRFVGKVEHLGITKAVSGTGEEAALKYLADPPAQRWLRSR